MDNKMSNIISFISQFNELKYYFLNGKCFWFVFILKNLFNGEIWYSQIYNHFVCKIDDYFYDSSGIIDSDRYDDLENFKEYIKKEPLNSIILYRDCIRYQSNDIINLSDVIDFFNKI